MFMENDISRGKNFLAIKVIDTVTFLPKRISNEDATPCTIIKFVIGGEICGIA